MHKKLGQYVEWGGFVALFVGAILAAHQLHILIPIGVGGFGIYAGRYLQK